MEQLIVTLLLLVISIRISKPAQQVKEIPEKPKHKQYDEDRYADYFIKEASKIYNLKKIPQEQSEEQEDNEAESDDIEFEEESDIAPNWLSQQNQYESQELEDIEIREKRFEKISNTLELTGIVCLYGVIITRQFFPGTDFFWVSKTLTSLLVKIAPMAPVILSVIIRILESQNKTLRIRVFTIIRELVILLLGLGYIAGQIIDFFQN